MKSKKPWEVEGVEWREMSFDKLISKEKYHVGKVKVRNGLTNFGRIPVVDQGQELIRGYLDNEKLKYRGPLPLIIFGDHTKVIKFIDFPFIVGADGVKNLIPNKNLLYPKYFYWLLRKVKLPDRGYARHFKFLKQATYLIPFRNGKPDLETQKKIVEYIEANFSRIDKILEKKKKELEQLDELWESVLEQVFKPKEGEEWKEMRLGEVCIIKPKKSEVKQLLEQNIEVSFIPMDYVDDTEGKIVRQKIRSIQSVYKGYTYFKEGDVLFAKITPCMENGKSAIACNLKNRIGFGSTEFHVLRPKESILSEFIFYFIRRKRFRNLAKLHFTGTVGHKRVPKEFLINSKIPIPFRNSKPDIEKQKEIANYLDNIYEKIKTLKEKNQNQIAQLEEMKESILDEMFNHENK